jgi:hypothetical protein
LKKEEMRFSIRFNPADPRHLKAARILNQVGRSKAMIVADALWEYDLRRSTQSGAELSSADSVADADAAPGVQSAPIAIKSPMPSGNEKADELQDAVLSGLSQFRME